MMMLIAEIQGLILAQLSGTEPSVQNWWQPIVQTGALGGMLLWLMFRVEKILNRIIDATNLASYTTSTAILDTKHKDEAITELAAKLQAQAHEALQNASKTPPGGRR